MLTEREKILQRMWWKAEGKADELYEVAVFEARVAATLAITGDAWDFEDMPCRGERQYMRSKCPLRKNHWDCSDCYIKAARLQVEEEMDAEMDK